MLFNSLAFAIFLPVVFLLYWGVSKNLKTQNIFLLAASYFFYGWWDWRFLSLVFLCSITNYIAGILMAKTDRQVVRKTVLITACIISLGVLGVFKYYDWFISTLADAMTTPLNIKLLHLILPVGISFYTFHTLSYTLDVYSGKFKATEDIVSFFLFVSIFPLAMAGPIERATNLLPQIYKPRTFNYGMAVDGMRQILWGLFKKVVVADNCAALANQIFDQYQTQEGSMLLLGAVFFTFQIYGDFSGYSDMALGIGKLFGFTFLQNFNFPYFSRDIAEFWRRWHMSLTNWFRDYLYIPLGGSRVSKLKMVRNTFIIFLVSGFWHGANWTFIVWGAYHALLFLPLILSNANRKHTNSVAEGKILPSLKEFFQMLLTFILVLFGWILFRAENITDAISYISKIFSSSLFTWPDVLNINKTLLALGFAFILLIMEWLGRENQFALEKLGLTWNRYFRYAMYYGIVLLIVFFAGQEQQFIYFQF